MAKSLPGCAIVGFYNENSGDFEEHNRVIDISNGKFDIKDTTKPYGFVSMDARVWFQKFIDDGVEHEYLMTEGYIWTGIYPESNRIIEKGNGQSMELFENVKGTWTEDDNGFGGIFIINEALISKLCILGENVEPCFEGAAIGSQFTFSLDEEYKNKVYSLIAEMKDILNEGGNKTMDSEENKGLSPEDTEFKKKPEDESEKNDESEDKNKKPENSDSEENKKDALNSDSDSEEEDEKKKKKAFKKSEDDEDEEDKAEDEKEDEKKKKYSLDEIPEYVELTNQFAKLQSDFNALKEEIAPLREFKENADRKAKEDMINSFCMLSDDDKKDCVENIDKYSLDQIEAKLSIICVRNKVNFNLDDDNKKTEPKIFSLGDNDDGDNAPAWIKAVRDTQKNM